MLWTTRDKLEFTSQTGPKVNWKLGCWEIKIFWQRKMIAYSKVYNFVCPPFILYFTSRINKSQAEEISSSHRTPGTKGVMHYFYLAYHNIILSKILGPLIIVSDLAMWRRAENLNGEWPRKTEIKIAVCRNAEKFRKVTMHFIFQWFLAHIVCGAPNCIAIVQCNLLMHLLQFLLMPISCKSIN